jgi:hypothetical protein
MRSHQVVIGATGTGKTTLLLRLWAGFMAAAQQRYAAGQGPRPLLVVLDCKGGADARRIADARGCCGRWPGPPRCGRTGRGCRCGTCRPAADHYPAGPDRHGAAPHTDVMEALVAGRGAPGGPPRGVPGLRDRLDAGGCRCPTRPPARPRTWP